MEACYKRANQRKLKNFQLSDNLLYLLYQSVVQGILLYDQVYSSYSNARKADWERLHSMTSAATTIIRHDIRSPTAICEEASLYKLRTIPCDRTHPLHTALSACAQSKGATQQSGSSQTKSERTGSSPSRPRRTGSSPQRPGRTGSSPSRPGRTGSSPPSPKRTGARTHCCKTVIRLFSASTR